MHVGDGNQLLKVINSRLGQVSRIIFLALANGLSAGQVADTTKPLIGFLKAAMQSDLSNIR